MTLETRTARPGTLCCACGRTIADGERALRWHLPPMVALMLEAEGHPHAFLYLCCDCAYTGYALFDYGMYRFDPQEEARLAALVDHSAAAATNAMATIRLTWTGHAIPQCGRCLQDVPDGRLVIHEGIGLCAACAAEIAPSRLP